MKDNSRRHHAVPALSLVGVLLTSSVLAQNPVEVGYRDFHYGNAPTHRPTAEKPQSKLWWNDGSWWGCLWDRSADAYRIHRFDVSTQSWTSVGPDGDDRPSTLVDALWDGSRLHIASHEYEGSDPSRLYSYDYDPAQDAYTLRSGFPVDINDEGAEALTIDQDTTGKLWVTWESGQRIMVNRTISGHDDWGTPFELPVQGSDTSSDDISAVAAFDGNIGIMWSNQSDKANYFAYRVDGNPDTQWEPRETALEDQAAGQVSDDHLNFAINCDAAANVYAISKGGLSGSSDPQIFLARRDPAGTWTMHVVARKMDDWTRPTMLIDDENRVAYVFAKSGDIANDAIHVKTTDLDNLGFTVGPGELFIQSDADDKMNDPTSTKQNVDSSTGLLLIACDRESKYYFHNYLELPGVPQPDIAVVPASFDYGIVEVGNPSSTTIQVRNEGSADLVVASTGIVGADGPEFSITSGGGSFTLSPGDSADIALEFSPASHGPKSAALEIASNDPAESVLGVPLSGTGLDPLTGVASAARGTPAVVLHPPRPHPTLAGTGSILQFELGGPATVRFRVFDVTGRLVAEREARRIDVSGLHTARWSPTLAAGTYYLRLETDSGEAATTTWVVLR